MPSSLEMARDSSRKDMALSVALLTENTRLLIPQAEDTPVILGRWTLGTVAGASQGGVGSSPWLCSFPGSDLGVFPLPTN